MNKKQFTFSAFLGSLLVLLLLILVTTGCDAPRNNPLDPQNPTYTYGEAGGIIYTLSFPRKGIEGAEIYLGNSLLTLTDSEGKFSLSGLEKSATQLMVKKTGYISDSIVVNWGTAKSKYYEFYLNQAPVADSISLYVTSVSRFTLPALHQVSIRVKLSDKDSDIDSVFLVSSSLGLRKQLSFNQTTKEYEKDIPSYDINIAEIEEVIGETFTVEVKDVSGRKFTFLTGGLKRVIRVPVVFSSPANGDTVSNPVRLSWQSYEGLFPFEQFIQLYSTDLDVNPVLVWEKSGVLSDSTSITVDKTLPSGSYFWVIWCVDQFSDRMRSNPASFQIR